MREAPALSRRIALGVAYRGGGYHGWQSQADGQTVQDHLERALSRFADAAVVTVCAGRTDTGVHGLNQVVHLDPPVPRDAASWVRGSNRYLPSDIAIQWCEPVADTFHARNSARGRRYNYLLLESPVRPAVETGMAGWVFRPLDGDAMRAAAAHLVGEHDFSSFRSSQCQATTPVKRLNSITIQRRGAYWRLDFDGVAFLHHMVRNRWAAWWRWGRAVDRRSGWPRCSRPATATQPHRPFPLTVCTSRGRTTMRCMACPNTPRLSTGSPE